MPGVSGVSDQSVVTAALQAGEIVAFVEMT